MSVISLLSAKSREELRQSWQSIDFEKIGIAFEDGCMMHSDKGLLIFHGVSFSFDIESVDQIKAGTQIFCSADIGNVRSAVKLDLGPAVAGGARVPAIVSLLMQLGKTLAGLLPAKAIFWSPASIISGFDYFAEAIGQYVDGAAFPALICVGFDTSDPCIVRTSGLSWFCGQELVFQHAPLTTGEAMRYVVRLVHDLATVGAVVCDTDVAGMCDGETISLAPDVGKNVLNARLIKH